MRVDDVGLILLDPTMKANPTPRICEALAHAKAAENYACRLELSRYVTAGSRERKDAYLPASFGHSGCEQDDLLLGAADAIESRNHKGNVLHVARSFCAWSITSS
jgi:hypothetical protein